MKYQIVNRSGAVLFECEVHEELASGLHARYALEQAVAARADLGGAVLRCMSARLNPWTMPGPGDWPGTDTVDPCELPADWQDLDDDELAERLEDAKDRAHDEWLHDLAWQS